MNRMGQKQKNNFPKGNNNDTFIYLFKLIDYSDKAISCIRTLNTKTGDIMKT